MSFSEYLAKLAPSLPRDLHLSNSEPAKSGGPDATLACRECGRAKWQHGTRHDTCSRFVWVRPRDVTRDMALAIRVERGCPRDLALACSRLCDDFGYHSETVKRPAREAIANAINKARAEVK